ncbi:MAG: hypothetical protein LUF90_00925 [Rikenellaceae bacterium]|nr:hypothetical protein [Rikenellaceae bacterium]
MSILRKRISNLMDGSDRRTRETVLNTIEKRDHTDWIDLYNMPCPLRNTVASSISTAT